MSSACKRPADGALGAAGMFGQEHGAHRDGGRHRADAGVDDAVADRGHQAASNRLDPLLATVLQHDAEFVGREPADAILAAQGAADAPPDNGDHLVADVVAIGLVHQRQIVDAGEQKRALVGVLSGVAEKAGQLLGQPGAVELTGQLVMAAEIDQPFLPLAAVVDDPERALRQARASLRVDRADAGVLEPQRRAAAASLGQKAIAEAIAQLRLGRDMRAAGDAVITGAGLLRIDQQSERAPPVDLVGAGDAQHRFGIGRPVDAVG